MLKVLNESVVVVPVCLKSRGQVGMLPRYALPAGEQLVGTALAHEDTRMVTVLPLGTVWPALGETSTTTPGIMWSSACA